MQSDAARGGPNAPFFTAPGHVVWFSAIIIVAHGLRVFAPVRLDNLTLYWLGLWPDRFHLMLAGGGDPVAYTPLTFLVSAFGHVFVHGDWMHVLLNTGMLLALGAPVARRHSALKFLGIFFLSALGGAIVFFLMHGPGDPPAIGASGGVCGILGAAFLLMAGPRAGWPELMSGTFLRTSAAFLLINMLLAFAGPSLFGAGIAWEAHIGGYIVGAVMMAALAHTR
ncbi:MAG: rhomboid family intramembrane serine protease [Hyphomonadaceae bacterium]|nr:rhomboid family intramembrane serine protease [Hyphomonadaceae bacterium]